MVQYPVEMDILYGAWLPIIWIADSKPRKYPSLSKFYYVLFVISQNITKSHYLPNGSSRVELREMST